MVGARECLGRMKKIFPEENATSKSNSLWNFLWNSLGLIPLNVSASIRVR
jgi:hypothetical protein